MDSNQLSEAAYFEGFADAREDATSCSTDTEDVQPFWDASLAKHNAQHTGRDLQAAQQALRDIVRILSETDPIGKPSEVWFRVGGAIGTAKMGLIFSGHRMDDAILEVDANPSGEMI